MTETIHLVVKVAYFAVEVAYLAIKLVQLAAMLGDGLRDLRQELID